MLRDMDAIDLDARSQVIFGRSEEVLATLPEDSLAAIVCDPPYGLTERQPDARAMLTAWLADETYEHADTQGGIMSAQWDRFVPGPHVWRACHRVLMPGAHMLVCSASRNVDLMGLALRLAGFEIRDTLAWCYGSGWARGMDMSKAVDAHLLFGATDSKALRRVNEERPGPARVRTGTLTNGKRNLVGNRTTGTSVKRDTPATAEGAAWQGFSTALRPAIEPILLVRKPLSGPVAVNLLEYGTGALDLARTATSERRVPSNVICDETLADAYDEGVGAPRFFYVPKPSRAEKRAGLSEDEPVHPSVKPVALMRWLVTLVTPPDGLVCDPFCGSGTTGVAAAALDVSFLGIDQDAGYVSMARRRIAHAYAEVADGRVERLRRRGAEDNRRR